MVWMEEQEKGAHGVVITSFGKLIKWPMPMQCTEYILHTYMKSYLVLGTHQMPSVRELRTNC